VIGVHAARRAATVHDVETALNEILAPQGQPDR